MFLNSTIAATTSSKAFLVCTISSRTGGDDMKWSKASDVSVLLILIKPACDRWQVLKYLFKVNK